MENRKLVYNAAKQLHPQRFSKGIRKKDSCYKIALNPTDEVNQITSIKEPSSQ